jgi:uncharacterized protein (TIGR00251 family)
MIFKVRVVTNSKTESIERMDGASYKIKVREKAIDGRANSAVIEAFAARFRVRKTSVSIISGVRSRNKVVEVSGAVEEK